MLTSHRQSTMMKLWVLQPMAPSLIWPQSLRWVPLGALYFWLLSSPPLWFSWEGKLLLLLLFFCKRFRWWLWMILYFPRTSRVDTLFFHAIFYACFPISQFDNAHLCTYALLHNLFVLCYVKYNCVKYWKARWKLTFVESWRVDSSNEGTWWSDKKLTTVIVLTQLDARLLDLSLLLAFLIFSNNLKQTFLATWIWENF